MCITDNEEEVKPSQNTPANAAQVISTGSAAKRTNKFNQSTIKQNAKREKQTNSLQRIFSPGSNQNNLTTTDVKPPPHNRLSNLDTSS